MMKSSFILTQCAENTHVVISSMDLEDSELTHYLYSLHLFPGESVYIIKNRGKRHPILIEVGQTCLALGYDLAEKVFVKKS